ncbi:hypothetical protein FO441_01110 [Salinicoccus cyprini]|uniref:asparagine synthase (glutamine-hydrolyzing) n=1 Tax=Salinicoccus cyprini TaxID=2493691 RepID=A0A558AXC8_9STAP|nr:asparagine synthase-related protein [Salinicoccus cyprini]TVT28909.1 hypothetical protein FO441_01110 [Salinicoccus cyprini]
MKKYHEFLQLGFISKSYSVKDNISLNYEYNGNFSEMDERKLLNEGYDILRKDIKKQINVGKDLVVPISGGLDSRLILSAILEFKNADSIKTYTYGTPGTLDYEIGNKIAATTGTNHRNLDLSSAEYKYEDLIDYSQKVDNPTVMFHNLSLSLMDLSESSILVSGFLGDVVSGKRLEFLDESKLESRKRYFRNMTLRNKFDVENEDIINYLSENTNYEDLDNLTEFEKLYILDYNLKSNYNHVLGYIDMDKVYTPFYNTDFMNFLLSLPASYRQNQSYYKKLIFEKASTYLNEVPLKNFYGTKYYSKNYSRYFHRTKNAIKHRISKKSNHFNSPYINYVDFRKKIILDKNFKRLLLGLLGDLRERGVNNYNSEIERAIEEINTNNITHPYNYLLLCSLEIYLKQGRMTLDESIH